MTFRKLILTLIITLLTSINVLTQADTNCDIDLSIIAGQLIEAQNAAGSGDATTALDILAEVEAQIASIRDACGGTLGAINIFTTGDGAFRWGYPASWVFEQVDHVTYVMASSAQTANRFFEADPTFESGEQVIGLLLGPVEQIGGSAGDDLSALVETYSLQVTDLGYELTVRDVATIGERSGEYLAFSGAGFDSGMWFFQLDDETTLLIVGTTASGEQATLEPIVADVVASLEAAPPPPIPEVVLSGEYNLAGLVNFNYPGDWIIGEADSFGATSIVTLASTAAILETINETDAIIPANEHVMAAVVTDHADFFNLPDTIQLEDMVAAVQSEMLVEFTVINVDYLNYGDYHSARIDFRGVGLNGSMDVLEIQQGQQYVLVFVFSALEEDEEGQQLLSAITASMQIPPGSRPLGPPRLSDN